MIYFNITMLNFIQVWIKRLRLNQIYGQLILFTVLPAGLLTTVGSWFVYTEIKQSYLLKQQYIAQSILAQQQKNIMDIEQQGWHTQEKLLAIQQTLKQVIQEKDAQSITLFYQGESIAIGEVIPQYILLAYIERKSTNQVFIGPILYQDNHVFAMPVMLDHDNKIHTAWLLLEMDNQGLTILIYRMILILSLIILISSALLFAGLSLYARYWLSPIYKIRLQLQQLTADNLNEYQMIKSSGELNQLQRDVYSLLKDLYQHFQELKHYAEETENDTRQMLDRIEIESANYQRELKTVKNINQSKSLFLANISHELRTPLNSIEGFVQLLLRQNSINAEQKVYLDTIKKSSAHLLALINDVLDYSKIEAGKLQLEQHSFHLEYAVFDVMDMLSPLASQKNLDLVFYYPKELPLSVVGDELRFKQILMNLISNAIKFTPEGEIIVRVRLEKTTKEHQLFYFSVQDSGIGLSGAEKNKLFESFSQADASIIRQYGGTGLGLAISKQLVQMMNGEIGFVDNQAFTPTEKGTTFWFTVQFNIDEQAEYSPSSAHVKPLKIISYLHHPAMASVLRYYLEDDGFEHHETHSAFDLLNQLHELQHNPPDWVMIDEQHDLEVSLKEIRQRYQGRVTVCGYQMSLDLALLKRYQACALYQPIYRTALWQLFYGEQQADTTEIFNGQHLQILAVDDHLPNLMVLEALLQEFQVQCVKASSGQEAVNIIEQRIQQQQPLFDLIFMDIQMPVMSGLDTTCAIRSLESTLNVPNTMPIIALSAHVFHDEKQKLLATGMNDFISKPIRMEQLLLILQQWTKKSSHRAIYDSAKTIQQAEQSNNAPVEQHSHLLHIDKDILDWQHSIELVANKPELAQDLLLMLVKSFDDTRNELQDLLDLEDFPALEPVLHRMYGATRYVGTPKLQRLTGDFEQFISTLRKQQRKADDDFISQVQQRFDELQDCMTQVEDAVKQLFPQHQDTQD